MAERDKIIKSGQITLPRILLLALAGGLIVAMVAVGGQALVIGYWLITLGICAVLLLVAIDYGIKLDDLELGSRQMTLPTPEPAVEAAESVKPAAAQPRPRRKSRSAKRRR